MEDCSNIDRFTRFGDVCLHVFKHRSQNREQSIKLKQEKS